MPELEIQSPPSALPAAGHTAAKRADNGLLERSTRTIGLARFEREQWPAVDPVMPLPTALDVQGALSAAARRPVCCENIHCHPEPVCLSENQGRGAGTILNGFIFGSAKVFPLRT